MPLYDATLNNLKRAAENYSSKISGSLEENVTIKGMENGACFQEANGEKNLSEAAIQQFNLGCDNIKFSQQHHAAHIGLVMQIMESGMDMDEAIKQEEFRCQPIYAISFAVDASKVIHPYWAGKITLYIAPDNFALLGYQYHSTLYQAKVALEGELTVNGIRMPQAKIYYKPEDGSYLFTDVFRPM